MDGVVTLWATLAAQAAADCKMPTAVALCGFGAPQHLHMLLCAVVGWGVGLSGAEVGFENFKWKREFRRRQGVFKVKFICCLRSLRHHAQLGRGK